MRQTRSLEIAGTIRIISCGTGLYAAAGGSEVHDNYNICGAGTSASCDRTTVRMGMIVIPCSMNNSRRDYSYKRRGTVIDARFTGMLDYNPLKRTPEEDMHYHDIMGLNSEIYGELVKQPVSVLLQEYDL